MNKRLSLPISHHKWQYNALKGPIIQFRGQLTYISVKSPLLGLLKLIFLESNVLQAVIFYVLLKKVMQIWNDEDEEMTKL